MVKLARPRGLVRYASEESLTGGKTHVIRPRTVGYALAALVGLVVVAIFVRRYEPFEANVLRAGAVPYAVDGATLRAPLAVHLVNKQSERSTIELAVEEEQGIVSVQLPTPQVTLEPFQGRTVPVLVSMPVAAWRPGFRVKIRAHDVLSGRDRHLLVEVLGPRHGGS
jgi:polyferredoxin